MMSPLPSFSLQFRLEIDGGVIYLFRAIRVAPGCNSSEQRDGPTPARRKPSPPFMEPMVTRRFVLKLDAASAKASSSLQAWFSNQIRVLFGLDSIFSTAASTSFRIFALHSLRSSPTGPHSHLHVAVTTNIRVVTYNSQPHS